MLPTLLVHSQLLLLPVLISVMQLLLRLIAPTQLMDPTVIVLMPSVDKLTVLNTLPIKPVAMLLPPLVMPTSMLFLSLVV